MIQTEFYILFEFEKIIPVSMVTVTFSGLWIVKPFTGNLTIRSAKMWNYTDFYTCISVSCNVYTCLLLKWFAPYR